VFDVNLRQSFYSADVIIESLERSSVVKLNDQEVPVVAGLLGFDRGEEKFAEQLIGTYGLKLVCVTRGARGSLLVSADARSDHPGFKVKVADTVGAGDAFTACAVHFLFNGAPLDEISEAANRFAAWVATNPGGTPSLQGRELDATLKAISAP